MQDEIYCEKVAKLTKDAVDELMTMADKVTQNDEHTAGKIFEAVKEEAEKQKNNIKIYICDDFEETIRTAKKVTKAGNIVLFSPASASFDMFKDFADRGNKFKEIVNNL